MTRFLEASILVLLSFVLATKGGPCSEIDAKTFLEKVLTNTRNKISDPIQLPNKEIRNIQLSDGEAWGLSTVQSTGSAKLSCAGNTVKMTSRFLIKEVKGKYNWEKQGFFDSWKGSVFLKAFDFSIDAEISQEMRDGAHPRLLSLKVRDMKNIKVEITGLGLLSWLTSQMTTSVSFLFKSQIAKVIEGPVTEAITIELLSISWPLF